eukprot:2530343-Pyramimonas_sp.AAC.2
MYCGVAWESPRLGATPTLAQETATRHIRPRAAEFAQQPFRDRGRRFFGRRGRDLVSGLQRGAHDARSRSCPLACRRGSARRPCARSTSLTTRWR